MPVTRSPRIASTPTTKRSAPVRYGAAVLIAAFALTLKLLLRPLLGDEAPFLLYFPAVVASAWFGGLDAGLITTAICASVVWFFFFIPYRSFSPPPIHGAVQIVTFIATAMMSSLMAENLHRARRLAARSAERLRIAQDHSLDGFVTLWAVRDAQGSLVDFRWEYVNPAAASMLECAQERLVGRGLLQMLPGERTKHDLFARCARVVETGEPVDVELPWGEEERPRWFRIMVVQLHDGIAVHFSDITARKRAEEERAALFGSERRARAEAEEANRLKDEFLATVSHELRTPLNAILGWSHLLQAKAVAPEQKERGLQAIERNARSQARLVEDILDVSRIITGKVRLDRHLIDPGAIIGAAVESLRPTADAKGVALELAVEAQDARILGDTTRLQQVCWNLVSNAIKFTPAGGVVRVSVAQRGADLHVEVADTGQGIRPDFLPFVFDRFSQGDSSTTRRHGGLGLGLAIVRQLVELHGGTISARSEGERRGATFEVVLPVAGPAEVGGGGLARARDSAAPERGAPPGAPEWRADGLRVLVVDDEDDAGEIAGAMLRELGVEPRVVRSAEEALRALAEFRPDILISDLGMPHEDGFSLMRKVRALPPDAGGAIPAIAVTAYARREDRQRALAAGFQVYLTKPIGAEELSEVVSNLAAELPPNPARTRAAAT
ncbi:ATP-binding response regulator [Sorangium sp. So ce233]|uniref:ATP-binding response regulator n=1 Tax=Sorangium sp. So ce233 TaxID=3133290 RepID=UPI003F60C329